MPTVNLVGARRSLGVSIFETKGILAPAAASPDLALSQYLPITEGTRSTSPETSVPQLPSTLPWRCTASTLMFPFTSALPAKLAVVSPFSK